VKREAEEDWRGSTDVDLAKGKAAKLAALKLVWIG
jgi:hypothetical protein